MSQIYKNSGGGTGPTGPTGPTGATGPTGPTGPAGVIQTIAGDTGTITGANVTIYAHNSTNNSGASVEFVNSGTISTLNVTDADGNTFVGNLSGNLAASTALQNTGFGASTLSALTVGDLNTMVGFFAGHAVTSGQNNTGIGNACLARVNTGSGNTACGLGSGADITSGDNNCAYGYGTLSNIGIGHTNVGIGLDAGQDYTSSESNNILISNDGVVGESNVMRLGTDGSGTREVDTCFIAGIIGNTVSNAQTVTIDSVTGQLGVSSGGGSNPAFSVALTSSTAALPSSTLSPVVYDTVLVDTASGFSAGSYTVPVGGGGNWFLSIVSNFATAVSFINCDTFIDKNTGSYLLHIEPSTPSDGITANNGSGSGIFVLADGDVINVKVFAITTGGATFTGQGASNGFFNIFSGYKVG